MVSWGGGVRGSGGGRKRGKSYVVAFEVGEVQRGGDVRCHGRLSAAGRAGDEPNVFVDRGLAIGSRQGAERTHGVGSAVGMKFVGTLEVQEDVDVIFWSE